jgi:hypothetical protein
MNAYPCEGFWHLGHLSPAVRRGDLSRDIYATTTTATTGRATR